jgi:DNA-binding NtrC family response regulator/pSer/pThr/pTyr-binding forkhead associated (FHA) protein
MPYLTVVKGREEIDKRQLCEDVITIGRGGLGLDDRPDIVLSDRSRRISRYHAAIILNRNGHYFIRDLGSASGITVNRQLIYRKLLRSDDRVEIGNYTLIYCEHERDTSAESLIIPVDEATYLSTESDRRSTKETSLSERKGFPLSVSVRQSFGDVLKQIRSSRCSEEILDRLIELLAFSIRAKRGFIALVRANEISGSVSTFGIDREKGERIRYLQTIVAHVIRKGKPIGRYPCLGMSVICSPLRARRETIGVVYLERELRKPFDEDDLRFLTLVCERVSPHISRERLSEDLAKEENLAADDFRWKAKMVGNSSTIKGIRKEIRTAAESDINLLLLGETGTGKEVAAQLIHEISPRKRGPFLAVELSKIAENLVESELFGHVKGAFTGAVQDKKGAFEMSQGGTLFIDEIGDISLEVQAKIRRAVEEKEIGRVGTAKVTKVDVRIISATNVDLEKAVSNGFFRGDLLERLGKRITLPPLRERKEDIPLLSHCFVDGCNNQFKCLSHGAMTALLEYDWPGNVRELRNLVTEFGIRNKEILHVWDLPRKIKRISERNIGNGHKAMAEIEKEAITEALAANSWNFTRTAKELGISKQTLYNKVKRYGIVRPKKT